MNALNVAIDIANLKTILNGVTIHENINLSIYQGETLAIVGGSGSGKTTLLRAMLALLKPAAGSIKILGKDILSLSATEMLTIQRSWGVLFQQNALFSSLTLLENVAFPMKEHTKLDEHSIHDLALMKIQLSGLPEDAAYKYPAELSGGMQKRAGLARALSLDPQILFLDEPTAGLDPTTAALFDDLILKLQKMMGLTIVMVTHDLDSMWRITNRVAFLGEKKVLAVSPMRELVKNKHPLIQAFFGGIRGKIAAKGYEVEG